MALDSALNTGGSTAGKANVDANYNLNVNLPLVETQGGYATIQCEVDDGTGITGVRTIRQPQASILDRLFVGSDTQLFCDGFNATAQNTTLWRSAATTMTTAQSGGYLVLNNSAITTTGTSAIYQTYRTFSLVEQQPLLFEFRHVLTAAMPINTVSEVGLFSANLGSQPYTPTDGVYIRFNPTGVIGVLNYNGTETPTTLIPAASQLFNDNVTYRIVVTTYRVEFWGQTSTSQPRILLGIVPTPTTFGPAFAAYSAPISIRLAFTGAAGSAIQPKVSSMVVLQQDIPQGKDFCVAQAGMGCIASQGQNGGTLGTTANYTNSMGAGAGAAIVNASAAAAFLGLGGQFSVLPTLAQGTDGILCSYQNPAGSVTQTPRQLYITGVRIQGAVTTILAGGPVTYAYSIAYGHTNVSLATTEAAAAKAPRRVALGFENYIVTAPAGTTGAGVMMQFVTPIVVNPGEFIAIVAKNVGVVTTTGVITILVTFDGFWE